ncbi:MAG TPA: alpha/beta hydrolase [Burkholderiales bacterium]|nr:alpha/beta hydrolase [Burkholderiales bacterium]
MRHESFQSLGNGAFHRIAYTDWGDAANPHVVLCVHGLARNSRDFDFFAGALADHCHVACMDVAGRGESEWLDNKAHYTFSTYQNDAAAMLARAMAPRQPSWFTGHSSKPTLDWVGTSMGGLLGMFLAAKRGSPIRRLVLNDVGALVPWSALFRMKGYITRGRRFSSLEEVEAYLREVCAPFGPLTDAQWRHLATHSAKWEEGAQSAPYQLRYDPSIGEGLHGHIDPEFPIGPDLLRGIDLWNVWSKLECPTLVLRGAQSEVLLKKTVDEMRERKPDLEVAEFEGVGHAPALMSADQIRVVKEFLLR